jgi:hypothetical protein
MALTLAILVECTWASSSTPLQALTAPQVMLSEASAPANAVAHAEAALPSAPRVLTQLLLSNSSISGSKFAAVTPCVGLPRLTIVGFGVGSVNEEYARLVDRSECCRDCTGARLALDVSLRFPHEMGEPLSVMGDNLQVPTGKLYSQPDLRPDEHHLRAIAVAMRAQQWVVLLAHVVSDGPDKWALRQLLAVLAVTLGALPSRNPPPLQLCLSLPG